MAHEFTDCQKRSIASQFGSDHNAYHIYIALNICGNILWRINTKSRLKTLKYAHVCAAKLCNNFWIFVRNCGPPRMRLGTVAISAPPLCTRHMSPATPVARMQIFFHYFLPLFTAFCLLFSSVLFYFLLLPLLGPLRFCRSHVIFVVVIVIIFLIC